MAKSYSVDRGKTDTIRVYMDGCFDLFHFGHANAIRQAKLLGDHLVVGIHSDEIARNKRPPVFTEQERYGLVRGLKWVDEVVEDTPYSPTLELLEKLNCAFASHADDLAIAKDGTDTYGQVRNAGRLRLFQRTQGVSTTDIVERVLRLFDQLEDLTKENLHSRSIRPVTLDQAYLSSSHFALFSGELKNPRPGDKTVYVTGGWDLFHAGHMDMLEAAKKQGDYLIVGVYTDTVVHKKKGGIFPILNLNERALGVLSCKCVDEVVIGAPFKITSAFMKQKNIDLVCHGWTELAIPDLDVDPFKEPRELGMLKMIDTGNRLTSEEILQRIIDRCCEYESTNREKIRRDAKCDCLDFQEC